MARGIQILASKDIDATKWNACVDRNAEGLIYSHSQYLDAVCDNWSGLVVNDYSAVMALPWRQKFGIRYLYEPAFIQQLGLIGNADIPAQELLSSVQSVVKYGDILLNWKNEQVANEWNAVKRTNLVIDLSGSYDSISSNYKKDLQQNLKKAAKETLIIDTNNDIDKAIELYQQSYGDRMHNITPVDYKRFSALCFQLLKDGRCFTRKVVNEKSELLSIGLFLKDSRRIYNMMNTTTDPGRSSEANHYLLDAVIREFSGQQLLFDFEGSDLPGVKSFYEKFGAMDQPYFYYHFNKLPGLIRWLKR